MSAGRNSDAIAAWRALTPTERAYAIGSLVALAEEEPMRHALDAARDLLRAASEPEAPWMTDLMVTPEEIDRALAAEPEAKACRICTTAPWFCSAHPVPLTSASTACPECGDTGTAKCIDPQRPDREIEAPCGRCSVRP